MKATTFAITTLLLAIGSISDAKLVEVTRRKLEKPPSKDLDDKPGNQDLGGNSGKEPGVGNGNGQGQANGNGFGVASYASSGSGKSGNRKMIVRDDSTKPTRGHSSESGKPMKAKDVLDEQRRLEASLEKHKSRTLEKPSMSMPNGKPPSKDIEDKPGNHDLGGNSGNYPGKGNNGNGKGQDNGVGYGVGYAGKSGAGGRRRNRNRRLEMVL